MAGVYVRRGDLARALALYEQSLAIREQVGDLQGKGATLSQMANVYAMQQDWQRAEALLRQSLEIGRGLGDAVSIAFDTVKLGQIAQARGDPATALARYRQGLAQFERLGAQREIAQVQQLIAELESGAGAPSADDPVAQALAAARQAAQAGNFQAAAQAQEEAVARLRAALQAAAAGAGEEQFRQGQIALSVLLYNLAGYYSRLGRHAEAVTCLEEVVALDERTGHPDLESDRQALAEARLMAALSPEERAQLEEAARQAQAQFEALTPEQRQQLEAAARQMVEQLATLPPEEVAALGARALAEQTRDAAIAARRGELDKARLITQIRANAARAAEGEAPGTPWEEVSRFLLAVAAALEGAPIPPAPAAYAEDLAAVLNAAEPPPGAE
jgi:tetratricopeptide (TPR) repeat protein